MNSAMVCFNAELILKTEQEGGRKTPIKNGFRTDLKYDNSQYRMTVIEFDQEFLCPGDCISVECNVLLYSDEEIDHLLKIGHTVIADGVNIIGVIKIKKTIGREKINWN